jgi:hypothetical protein
MLKLTIQPRERETGAQYREAVKDFRENFRFVIGQRENKSLRPKRRAEAFVV